jgi:hypothetical protein
MRLKSMSQGLVTGFCCLRTLGNGLYCLLCPAWTVVGRFLMVELHMNLLADKLNLAELEESLRNLPDEVNKTYEQALQRIDDYSASRKELAMTVLM